MQAAERPLTSGLIAQPGERGNFRSRGMPLRVAVVCDFLEERWRSMDLVADMLCNHLATEFGDEIAVAQIRPPMRRRLTAFPMLEQSATWNADRLINRFADYPLRLRAIRDQFDLFHLVDHSYGQLLHNLPAERTIVTCHDLDTFRSLLDPDREPRPWWFRAMARRSLAGFGKAAHVIAVSNATRDEVVRHGIIPPDRISVVANGVHPAYSAQPDPAADAEAAGLLQMSSPNAPWLLNVGTTIPRKRIDLLLQIFAAIRRKRPDARLARVGGAFNEAQLQLVRSLQLEDAITTLPYLTPAVLAAVYRRAALLLQTAESEGFGLPLIEAMACGCPVVASDITVLREVGGQEVTYCPVGDIAAWTRAVTQLLAEKETEQAWRQRRCRAQTHANRFSWAENARQTANIYKAVLNRCEGSRNL